VVRAIGSFERAESIGFLPNAGTALKLAWLHLLAGHPEEFEHSIARAVEAQGGAAEVHLLRGRERVAARRFDEAVAAYSTAVAVEPANPLTHLGLGTVLAGLGDMDGAAGAFQGGVRELPESATLHYNLGVARALSGDLDGAASSFRATLAIDPNRIEARENLETVLARRGVR
jgi:Flp pilus assembly protein TadD